MKIRCMLDRHLVEKDECRDLAACVHCGRKFTGTVIYASKGWHHLRFLDG